MDPSQDNAPTALLERMKQRADDLAQKAEDRRREAESQVASSENVDYFLQTFQQKKTDLEKKIEEADNINKSELNNHLDELVKDMQEVQQLLNESSMFLASFQIKKAQQEVNELNRSVYERIEELQPKKKFGFGKKNKVEKTVKPKPKPDEADGDAARKNEALDELIEKQFFGFKDEADQTLTKSPDEVQNRQLNLINLQDCKVIALGNPSTVQMASLKNCTVIIGPTSRSAFIKGCVDCKFVIACQQLRIHNTTATQVYLHVTGAAIIENCQQVEFAPYTLSYPELDDHYFQSGLDLNTNYWNKIDDFNWINENEESPNWSLIPEDDRCDNWLE